MVELLVVIGIIALLISILLPALNRAMESAKGVKCLSNIRQIGLAFSMYVNDNHGAFPAPGADHVPDDWIYWESNRNVEDSALASYISKPFNPAVFQCPSDDVQARRPGAESYIYSYSVNELICEPRKGGVPKTTVRITNIFHPSAKMLAIDEAEFSLDDGDWSPLDWFKNNRNVLSNRHDKRSEDMKNPDAGRGNVLFCDGHAAFVERKDSLDSLFIDPTRDY